MTLYIFVMHMTKEFSMTADQILKENFLSFVLIFIQIINNCTTSILRLKYIFYNPRHLQNHINIFILKHDLKIKWCTLTKVQDIIFQNLITQMYIFQKIFAFYIIEIYILYETLHLSIVKKHSA